MKVALAVLALTACADPVETPVCNATPTTYRIDSVVLAHNDVEARALGLDLDDNRTPDNLVGQFGALLHGMFGDAFELAPAIQAHLAGDTDWRLAVWDCEVGQQAAVLEGGADLDQPLIGVGGDGIARGDGGSLPLGALWDVEGSGRPGFVAAELAAIRVDSATDDQLTARIGFAIDSEVATPVITGGIARFVNEHLEGSLRSELDTDADGTISEDELRHNVYVQSLLAPDLVIDRVETVSFGLSVHATRVP